MTKRALKKNLGKIPTLRIVGGEWRGRKLAFHEANGLRPTGDRLRETLFNWLQWDIRGSRCLDLYAGSGALGFEAASRGANSVVVVENNPVTSRQLEANRQLLQADSIDVVQADALSFLRSVSSIFDIVFVDPPFALQQAGEICSAVESAGVLDKQAFIYVEIPTTQSCHVPPNWSVIKSSRAGQVLATLYQRESQTRDILS